MAKGYHHVTRELRCQIEVLKASGYSRRAIGKRLVVSAATISRELRRNQNVRKSGPRCNRDIQNLRC